MAALRHLRTCVFQEYSCPFRCWVKAPQSSASRQLIPGNQLEHHLSECPAFELECEGCGLAYLRSEAGSHDCHTALQAVIALETTALQKEQRRYGVDLQLLNPRCAAGHLMSYLRGKPPSYRGVICDKCRAP